MGMNYREFVHPEDADKVFLAFNEVFRTGQPNPLIEFRVIRIDGVVRALEGSVALLRNTAGEVIGFHGICRDRTDRKKAEESLAESEEKYRQVVENAGEGIYILQDGVIRFANSKMARLSGISVEALVGTSFDQLIFPEDREDFRKWEAQLAKGVKALTSHTFRIRRVDGETLWVEVNAVPVPWEGRPAMLHFLRDMSLQKR